MPTTEQISSLTLDRARRHEFDERIRAAQVDLLYARAPSMVAGLFVAASLVVWTMWKVVSPQVIWGWSACFFGYLALRIWRYIQYRRTTIPPAALERWLSVSSVGSLISGCLWGAASLLMWVP